MRFELGWGARYLLVGWGLVLRESLGQGNAVNKASDKGA